MKTDGFINIMINNIIYYFIHCGVNFMVLPFLLFNCYNVSHLLAEWYCIDYWQMSRNIDFLHSLISKSTMSIQIFVFPYLFRSNQGLCHGKFSEKQRTKSLSSFDKASHVKYNCFKHFICISNAVLMLNWEWDFLRLFETFWDVSRLL